MNERDIFWAAIEIIDPAKRAAYLDQACADNAELRAQVEELLETHAETSQFLETPAVATDSVIDMTILTDSANTDEETGDQRSSGEAEFCKYLEPATRPGWLGRLAHYEIEEILGRGAFGIVAKAFDEKLHRVVAIKLMSPALAITSAPRKRFLREARAAAAVTQENIVAIHAVEEEPLPYLVLEYIAGPTLQQRMDEYGPLEVPEVLRIGQQVAAGLAAAHAAHLIHRDIKPSNILLADGPNLRVKISDFGLARAVDDATMTSSGLIAGTPMYMAPEQARGERLDHRADLFSLGSVLYQMVGGRPPFRAANTLAVLKRVCEDMPRPLDDVLPGTPAWLETIIFRLLEKDRNDRYQTAQEVVDLLTICQRELEHDGKVTCVEGLSGTAKTQVFRGKKSMDFGSKKKPLNWLVAGVIAVAAVIGLALMNGGKETPVFDATGSAIDMTADLANEKSENPAETNTWHGWPTDAPPPAIAPFDATQAQRHQQTWAKYLGVPVEYENSIGMKFRLIPPGEFLMGSTPEEIAMALKMAGEDEVWKDAIKTEGPQHKVILTQPVYVGATEVTQTQYEQVMGTNPSHFSATGDGKGEVANLETGNHPVEKVSWNDAAEFCVKLSQQENLKPFYFRSGETVAALEGTGYRLPTEAEWEFACRAGTTTRFWCGDAIEELISASWFVANSGGRTHAADELKANPFGLSGVHGNVWEWVQDSWDPAFYVKFNGNPTTDPYRAFPAGSWRVVRGGDWHNPSSLCRSSNRRDSPATYRHDFIGFRVVLSVHAVEDAISRQFEPATNTTWHGWPVDAPAPAIAPFDAEQAKAHQEAWAKHLGVPVDNTNSIGMKFRLIPPGEFLMGSNNEEIAKYLDVARKVRKEKNDRWYVEKTQEEKPEHKVTLTTPFGLAIHEVTRGQFRQFVDATGYKTDAEKDGRGGHGFKDGKVVEAPEFLWNSNLGFEIEQTDDHPVINVSWNDAVAFCKWLSEKEGVTYRLPTEAEWEFACRAGNQGRYCFGDDEAKLADFAWYDDLGGRGTKPVGQKASNAFGLFDLHGNAWEWCNDKIGPYNAAHAIDPVQMNGADERVWRGGNFNGHSGWARSAFRGRSATFHRGFNYGFRPARPYKLSP